MTCEEAVEIHCVALLASFGRIVGMTRDLSHLNNASKDLKEEMEVADFHMRQAFNAKNVLAQAKRTQEDLAGKVK